MSYIPDYYRRSFYHNDDYKGVIGVGKRDEINEKINKTLDIIYDRSHALSCLVFQDTSSLYKILASENIELKPYFEQQSTSKKIGLDAEEEEVEKEEENLTNEHLVNPKEKARHFITLEEMLRGNVTLVISISNVPVDILMYGALVEELLTYLVVEIHRSVPSLKLKSDSKDLEISKVFQWSYMGVKGGEDIFVRFDDVVMLYMFWKFFDNFEIAGVTIHVGKDKSAEAIFQRINEKFDIDLKPLNTLKEKVILHIAELQQIGAKARESEQKEDDYLTRFRKMSETYIVNPKDLFDVPVDMVEKVKQNILDFRLHVLKDLEKKQRERALQDKLEARKQTNKVHEISAETKRPHRYGKPVSDIQFESMLQSREKAAAEKNYLVKLNQYKRREEARMKNYINFSKFNKHESYINSVVPQQRRKFLASFVDGVVNENNKIDKNFTYYTKHANYVKYRLNSKTNEEKLDKLDEDEEEKENLELNDEKNDLKTTTGVIDRNDHVLKNPAYTEGGRE